jgi:hypothetical protein
MHGRGLRDEAERLGVLLQRLADKVAEELAHPEAARRRFRSVAAVTLEQHMPAVIIAATLAAEHPPPPPPPLPPGRARGAAPGGAPEGGPGGGRGGAVERDAASVLAFNSLVEPPSREPMDAPIRDRLGWQQGGREAQAARQGGAGPLGGRNQRAAAAAAAAAAADDDGGGDVDENEFEYNMDDDFIDDGDADATPGPEQVGTAD